MAGEGLLSPAFHALFSPVWREKFDRPRGCDLQRCKIRRLFHLFSLLRSECGRGGDQGGLVMGVYFIYTYIYIYPVQGRFDHPHPHPLIHTHTLSLAQKREKVEKVGHLHVSAGQGPYSSPASWREKWREKGEKRSRPASALQAIPSPDPPGLDDRPGPATGRRIRRPQTLARRHAALDRRKAQILAPARPETPQTAHPTQPHHQGEPMTTDLRPQDAEWQPDQPRTRHPNQCVDCRAFRVDGNPPTVHFGGCRHWRRSQNDVLRTSSGYVSGKGRKW